MKCPVQLAESTEEKTSEAEAVFKSGQPTRPAKKEPMQTLGGFDEEEEEEEEDSDQEGTANNDV